MALNTTPIFSGAPIAPEPERFVTADSTNAKTIFTAASPDGSRVVGISATNTSSAASIVQLFVRISGTNYLIGVTSVAAITASIAGVSSLLNTTGTPWVQQDVNGNRYIDLPSGAELQASLFGALGAGNLDIVVFSNTLSAP